MLMGAMFDSRIPSLRRRFRAARRCRLWTQNGMNENGPADDARRATKIDRQSGARAHPHHEAVESKLGDLQPGEGIGAEGYEAVVEFLEMRIAF